MRPFAQIDRAIVDLLGEGAALLLTGLRRVSWLLRIGATAAAWELKDVLVLLLGDDHRLMRILWIDEAWLMFDWSRTVAMGY